EPRRRPGERRRTGDRSALGAGGRQARRADLRLRAHPRPRRARGGARVPPRLRPARLHQHRRRAALPVRAGPPRAPLDEREPVRDPALAGGAEL
ncbi:MAG: hypothetical protein AVDCRST_MAG40-2677, partial [uncultured Gemmatimonadaceae bacterium]